jgi:hypothetical protein
MKFEVFNTKDSRVKVLAVISASSLEEARAKAHAMNPDYAVVAVPSIQESSRAYPVELREASPTLGELQVTITAAVTKTMARARDVEVRTDGTVLYKVDDGLFRRTWAVGEDGTVTLGDPEEIEMVAQPVGERRSSPDPLRRLSEAMNLGQSDEFHKQFTRGRNGSGNALEDAGRAMGLDGFILQEFLKGRD